MKSPILNTHLIENNIDFNLLLKTGYEVEQANKKFLQIIGEAAFFVLQKLIPANLDC